MHVLFGDVYPPSPKRAETLPSPKPGDKMRHPRITTIGTPRTDGTIHIALDNNPSARCVSQSPSLTCAIGLPLESYDPIPWFPDICLWACDNFFPDGFKSLPPTVFPRTLRPYLYILRAAIVGIERVGDSDSHSQSDSQGIKGRSSQVRSNLVELGDRAST